MSQILRQSTQIKVVIGPVVAVGDGFTPVTTLSLSTADEAEIIKSDAGSVTDISAATFAAITSADGYYNLTLTTSHTDTVGLMTVLINDDSLCLPVKATFQVVEEAVYDALFAASAAGYQVPIWAAASSTVNLSGTTVATVTTATNVTTVNGLAADVITATSIQANAFTAAKFAAGAFDAVWTVATRTLTSISGLGIALATKLTKYVQLLARKDSAIATDNATELTEINANGGSGGGAYANTTDSLEALRDNAGTNGAAYVFASGALANITAWTVAITGNLSGSVGSVTGAVGSVTNPVTVTGDCATAGTRFLTMIELDGSVYRYTTNSLEQAPSGGGGTDWTADERTALRTILGIPSSGTTPENPTAGILDTIRDDTNEMQTDWANGGRLDNILDARASQASVDDLPTNAELATAISDFLTTHGLTASRTGTAQAGAAGTITLDASASATNDIYNGMLCRIVSGTGAGQWRVIYDYVGATKVAHVKPNWTTTPDNTSVFAVRSCSAADIQLLNGDNEIGDSDRFPSVT